MASSVNTVVPPQYQPPISVAPLLPVGGIVDPSTGNAASQITDAGAAVQLDAVVSLLGNILVELQLSNEQMFPGVNFQSEREGRYS